jgi:catechol 2,3-dioxygenase-like lactoylglutathione lyase family enzyme
MLQDGRVAIRIPTQDLDRARRFYSEKLGLEASEEREGGLLYHCADGTKFVLYASTGRSPGTFTQMGFEVDDIQATVAELKARGLEFEYEGITEVPGHYPSTGAKGERAVWFRDSENNLVGIGEPIY